MNKNRINISIDDVSPHPKSSLKVVDRCFELIEKFPDIKFSLFVPIAYWRTRTRGAISKNPYVIWKYPEFCQGLKDLPSKNFEICYHGYYHGIPGQTDNDEFWKITYDEAVDRVESMKGRVERAGLTDLFKPIFRPPAWRLAPHCWDALHEGGFKLFAVTDLPYALETYAGKDKEYRSNYSTIFPPFRDLQLKESCGIVYHACEWDRNFLNKKNTDSLSEFLEKNIEEIEFVFMEDL